MSNKITPAQWNELVLGQKIRAIKVSHDTVRIKLANFHNILIEASQSHGEYDEIYVEVETHEDEWDFEGEWSEPSYFDD